MALYGNHGETPVCFDNETGFFHPVAKDENGYDAPDYSVKLKSVGEEWHTFDRGDEDALPHNVFYASHVVDVEVA